MISRGQARELKKVRESLGQLEASMDQRIREAIIEERDEARLEMPSLVAAEVLQKRYQEQGYGTKLDFEEKDRFHESWTKHYLVVYVHDV